MTLFAVLASIVSLAFCLVVLGKFRKSHRPEFAFWALGLVIFAAAAAFQSVGEIWGFSVPVFRGFYLFGGALGVIYLALGTVFLMLPRPAAWSVTAIVVVASLVVGIDALIVPVNTNDLTTGSGVLGEAIAHGSALFIGVVIFNIVGTVILVGGSALSAWRLFRTRSRVDLLLCNVLLTVGALIIATGFSAAKTIGVGFDMLGAYELVGIAVMFSGFLSLGRIGVPSRAVPQVSSAITGS